MKSKKCSCGAEMVFIKNDETGKWMPCNAKEEFLMIMCPDTMKNKLIKGHRPHWQDCPYAEHFRRDRPNGGAKGST